MRADWWKIALVWALLAVGEPASVAAQEAPENCNTIRLSGKGACKFDNGDRFEGEFKDGAFVQGTYRLANGESYAGPWHDGRPEGKGVWTWPSGSRYEGTFRAGSMEGQGIKKWANGATYTGEWKADQAHGQGTFTARDGETYTGAWNNGCFRQGDRKAWTSSKEECGF